MGVLDERPVWSMSGGETLSALDAVNAEIARLQTRALHLIAGLDNTGYANEIGAHDTARLLSARYRLDAAKAHRDVRLARALPKYPAVTAALPATTPTPATDPATDSSGTADTGTGDTATDGATADGAASAGAGPDSAGSDSAGPDGAGPDGAAVDGAAADGGEGEASGDPVGRPLSPAQAQAIVWSLERVATRVPAEHLAVAEEQLVNLAAHLSPAELRTAGKEITDLLDSDGPGPAEDKAYQRESLTLATAENGVKFRGFLANENAELLRSITHAGARPHKTLDGELDPRPREKRQADALTTALTIAASVTETGHRPPATTPTRTDRPTTTDLTNPATASDTGDRQPAATPARTDRATATEPGRTSTGDRPPTPTTASDTTAPATTTAATTTEPGLAPTGDRPPTPTTAPDTTAPTTAATAPEPGLASTGDRPTTSATALDTPAPTTAATEPHHNTAEANHTPDPPTLIPSPDHTAGASTNRAGSGVPDSAATTTHPAPAPVGTAASGGTAGTAGAAGGWVPGFGAKANITVTIDFNDLKAATADATGQLVYGDALSAAAIRRLACDANILPLVLGSNSEPLDVGRSERLVNRAMRRALNARDKGCVVCGAPPIQCDAHHVTSWIDGGPTAITNLVLLCRRHHIDLHAGHWTITITNGTVQVSRPTWADPPPPHTRRAGPQPPRTHSLATAAPPNPSASTHPDPPGVPDQIGIPARTGVLARDGVADWDGAPVRDGVPGRDGVPIRDGVPGRDGVPVRDGIPGRDGVSASDGVPGRDGALARNAVADRDGVPDPAGVSDRDGVLDPDGAARREAARLECWGEETPAGPEGSRSISRWPDETTRREAARFAVWGDPALTTEPIGVSPPPGR